MDMRKTEHELTAFKPHVSRFYKHQNEIILGLAELDAMHRKESKDAERDGKQQQDDGNVQLVRRAVNISFACNVLLCVLKVVAAIQSRSLSVIASMLDSVLDLLSGSILYLISRAIRRRDPYKFPVSKSRLEPVGIIIFASIMGMASLQIFQTAVQTLAKGSSDMEQTDFSFGILIATIGSKALLFVYCTVAARLSSIVDALASDHRNDVLTNSIGLAGFLLTGKDGRLWWCDAVGAMILSLYIIVMWIKNGKAQISLLVGKAASPAFIGRLTYMAAHHDPRILRVDKVLAYHFGLRYMVEVDIVLPETMPLRETHDIGDSLEREIEELETVERAFVHIDYEWEHKAEHKVIIDH